MKRTMLAIVLFPLCMKGQIMNDSVQTKRNVVEIEIGELSVLYEQSQSFLELKEKYNTLQKKHSTDSARIKLLMMKVDSLIQVNNDIKKSNICLRDSLVNSDKELIRVASNFLYVPYEAYGVEKIARHAFLSVTNKELFNKHRVRGVLLDNYRTDVENFVKFLKQIPSSLRNRFDKSAIGNLTKKFHDERYYVNYMKYDDWEGTYLGKMFLEVNRRLKEYESSTKIEIDDLVNKLETCLESVKEL